MPSASPAVIMREPATSLPAMRMRSPMALMPLPSAPRMVLSTMAASLQLCLQLAADAVAAGLDDGVADRLQPGAGKVDAHAAPVLALGRPLADREAGDDDIVGFDHKARGQHATQSLEHDGRTPATGSLDRDPLVLVIERANTDHVARARLIDGTLDGGEGSGRGRPVAIDGQRAAGRIAGEREGPAG
jgi:hypothetical protein